MEPPHVRLVWITLLAITPQDGIARVSTRALAHTARVTEEEAEEALQILQEPDPHSMTPDNEGRRIRAVEGGFELLNWHKYRSLMQSAVARDKNRQYVASHRQKKRQEEEGGDGTAPDPSKSLTEAARGQGGASDEGVTPASEGEVPEIATTPGVRGRSYRGKPPSVDEVQAAASMLGVPASEADKFFQHYSSTADEDENGREFWQVNGAKVTNWQSLLAKWGTNWRERNQKNRPNMPEHPPIVPMNHIERDPAP